MRQRGGPVILALILLAGPWPAEADPWNDVTFQALPCAALCMSGLPESITVDPCGNPEPAGTFDDVIVVVPEEMNFLEFEGFPEVDWEIAICDEQGRVLDLSINDVLQGCESAIGHPMVPVGCVERASATVMPGGSYVLRAFNFSDPHEMPGRYRFSFVSPPDYGPPPPSADPPLAGRLTRLEAHGNGGRLLQVPREVRITRQSISLELIDSTYAFAVLARPECDVAIDTACFIGSVMAALRWPSTRPTYLATNVVLSGPIEAYIFTDGRAILRLSFPELDGLVEIETSGEVSGEVVDLPVRCEPHTDCAVGYGGVTRDLVDGGYFGYLAYARRPAYTLLRAPAQGSVTVRGCRYTDDTDPADHPRGCDMFPDDSSVDGLAATIDFAASAALGADRSGMAEYGTWSASGPLYFGFVAEAWSHEPGSYFGAYAFWIARGID